MSSSWLLYFKEIGKKRKGLEFGFMIILIWYLSRIGKGKVNAKGKADSG
jgi:hypothetical protein